MSYAFLHSAGQSRKVARARACCIEFRRLVRGLDCESVRPRQERTPLNNVAKTDVHGSFQVHYVRRAVRREMDMPYSRRTYYLITFEDHGAKSNFS